MSTTASEISRSAGPLRRRAPRASNSRPPPAPSPRRSSADATDASQRRSTPRHSRAPDRQRNLVQNLASTDPPRGKGSSNAFTSTIGTWAVRTVYEHRDDQGTRDSPAVALEGRRPLASGGAPQPHRRAPVDHRCSDGSADPRSGPHAARRVDCRTAQPLGQEDRQGQQLDQNWNIEFHEHPSPSVNFRLRPFLMFIQALAEHINFH